MSAQTAVIYNEKRLIPAPRLNFSHTNVRSADGSIVGRNLQVTLSGQLVGCKGWDFTDSDPEFYTGSDYPSDGGSGCDRFTSLVKMQDKIANELFAMNQDYKWFEVIGCDGNYINKWLARVISVEFAEGADENSPAWVNTVPYTIVLELQEDEEDRDNPRSYTDFTENWDIQFSEEEGNIYELTHTLSCTSEEFYDVDENQLISGWQIAKEWVDDRLAGSDYTGAAPITIKNSRIFSGGFALSDYSAYNYTIQRSIDEYAGTYSISETWKLAKNPVFRQWSITCSKNRDDYTNVKVDGSFKSFLNRTSTNDPSNGTAAIDAFNSWGDSGAFTAAQGNYCGYSTLKSCPVNKSVTITKESRGDGTSVYGEQSRVVEFSYEFSDAPNTAEVSITRELQTSLLDDCKTVVTISGNIQGHECDGDSDKITNARIAYGLISCSNEADDIYNGGGTLTLISTSYSENEVDGTISFSCQYSDKLDENSQLKEEKFTTTWSCNDKTGISTVGSSLTSLSSGKTTYNVSGSIQALCDDSTPTAPTTTSYGSGDFGTSGSIYLRQSSVTIDEINNVVEWNYQYDNDGEASVEISTERRVGPENCDEETLVLNISSHGKGCDSASQLANAQTGLNSLTLSDYVDEKFCQTSFSENKNYTNGSIQRTYEYTTECAAIVNVTSTESYDSSECDKIRLDISGEIKGHCYTDGKTALESAQEIFANHSTNDYGDGKCLLSSSVSTNEKEGKISFNYSYSTCDNESYEHEQTITQTSNEQQCCDSITISGTITPYCKDDKTQTQIASDAWSSIKSDLLSIASNYIDNPVLNRTTVSTNQNNGQINYTYEYNTCTTTFTDALEESIEITKENPANVVAIVPILGRTCGPLVQDKGTKTIEKCTVSISVLFNAKCNTLGKPGTLDSEVASVLSNASCCSGAENIYTERDNESWNPRTGRFTRTVTYVCECC